MVGLERACAAAPPTIACSIGVSTSRKPRLSRKRRMLRTIAAALAEHLAHLGVDHQVDVALAVADLDVRQAVPLLGQRPRRLGQDLHALGHDGQLAGLRDRRAAHHADEVAALRLLPERERRLAEQILADPDLDLARCGPGASRRPSCRTPRKATMRPATAKSSSVSSGGAATSRRRPVGRRRRRDAREPGQDLGRRVGGRRSRWHMDLPPRARISATFFRRSSISSRSSAISLHGLSTARSPLTRAQLRRLLKLIHRCHDLFQLCE